MDDDSKACPVCGETIKAVAVKCRFCNEDLVKWEAARQAEIETDIFVGRPAAIYTVGQLFLTIITLGIAGVIYWIRSLSTKYIITTQRLKLEKGVFSKTKNSVEVFRIDDFDLVQPFSMRLLGYSALHVKSSDRNVADIYLYGIKDMEGLYEQIRKCSLKERERRGIKVWANA